jgi:hypothetical protein
MVLNLASLKLGNALISKGYSSLKAQTRNASKAFVRRLSRNYHVFFHNGTTTITEVHTA